MKIKNKDKPDNKKELPGYKHYPDNEDIYSKDQETDIDPEKLIENSINVHLSTNEELLKKKSIVTLEELDVPGSELDDEAETIGAEDEENNYYSLGGDNHCDLDEVKGG